MKRIARLLSVLALTMGLCTSAAFAATGPAVVATVMTAREITPSVQAFLAPRAGIPGTDLPGVIETAVVAALIWIFSLGIHFIMAPQTSEEAPRDESRLGSAH